MGSCQFEFVCFRFFYCVLILENLEEDNKIRGLILDVEF